MLIDCLLNLDNDGAISSWGLSQDSNFNNVILRLLIDQSAQQLGFNHSPTGIALIV
jgi:hypothetical protein